MLIGHNEHPSSFPAAVYAVEQMGREAIVILETEQGEKLKITSKPQINFHRGETLWVGIQEEFSTLFDPETQTNLL